MAITSQNDDAFREQMNRQIGDNFQTTSKKESGSLLHKQMINNRTIPGTITFRFETLCKVALLNAHYCYGGNRSALINDLIKAEYQRTFGSDQIKRSDLRKLQGKIPDDVYAWAKAHAE